MRDESCPFIAKSTKHTIDSKVKDLSATGAQAPKRGQVEEATKQTLS